MSDAPVAIGIAVVERADGSYLVGTRPEGVPLAGYAEFPGGKCEPGETPAACAVRECLEETGLAVVAKRTFERVVWEYPHGPVELTFVLCEVQEASAEPMVPFRWVSRSELSTLTFPQANQSLLRLLSP